MKIHGALRLHGQHDIALGHMLIIDIKGILHRYPEQVVILLHLHLVGADAIIKSPMVVA